MNILPEVWLDLERRVKAVKAAMVHLEQGLIEQVLDLKYPTEETYLLMGMLEKIRDITLPDCHMQSEWTGGDPDDPGNHTKREPNCCPMPRRRFTKEEMEASGLVCHGPCDWSEV